MLSRIACLVAAIGCSKPGPKPAPAPGPNSPSPVAAGQQPTPSIERPETAMSRDRLWSLIESAEYASSPDGFRGRLQARLETLSPAEIAAFDRELAALYEPLATWRFRAAAVLNGAVELKDYAGWVIAHGERRYARTLADPDSLAEIDYPEDGTDLEWLWFVPSEAYENRTGTELDSAAAYATDQIGKGGPVRPQQWREMRRRFPTSWAKHGAVYLEMLEMQHPGISSPP